MDFSELPYEVQFQYLLGLNPVDIWSYCRTSTAALMICRDENFWLMKIIRDLGPHLINYKPENETYSQQYVRLLNLAGSYDSAVAHPVIEAYDPRFGDFDIDVLDDLLEEIFTYGTLDGVSLIMNLGYPINEVIDRGLYDGDIRLLNLLAARGWRPTPDQKTIEAGIQTDDPKIMEWLEQHGVEIPSTAISYAVADCDVNVVEWLTQRFRKDPDFWKAFGQALRSVEPRCQNEIEDLYRGSQM